MLDNVIHYMYESERQNFEEYFANGGKKGGHILKYIHSAILEAIDGNVDLQMLNQALELTEDIREIYIEKE